MPAYEGTTFDVCVQGFERLRSHEEFILITAIDSDSDSADLLEQWLADVDSCERPADFHYDAAPQAGRAYYESSVRPLFDHKSNPFSLEPTRDDIPPYDQGCTAFLYVRVAGAHFPVY